MKVDLKKWFRINIDSPFKINKTFLLSSREISLLLILSTLVGGLAGSIGTVFHICVDTVIHWRTALIDSASVFDLPGWLIPVVSSAIMLQLTLMLVRRFAPEAGGSGVQEIEGALEGVRPLRWRRLLPVKFTAGLLTLGSGMVMGREGPTIQMGGNIGRMIAEKFKADGNKENTLVTAGAAAGLTTAFNAPLSGILFAIEEMRAGFKYGTYSVQAVATASFTAAVIVRLYMGQIPDIDMSHFKAPALASLPLFFLFGVVFGLFGVLFSRYLVKTLDFFSNLRGPAYTLTGLWAGGLIGYLGWRFPHITGGGDDLIVWAMHYGGAASFLMILFISRIGTSLFSYGTGAPGGIFAPMLALGTLFGLWFGHYAHSWFPEIIQHPGVFTIAGMGALFAATVRAPLTGIVLSIEMTNNYSLILPMILTVASATVTAELLGSKPVYTTLLQRTLRLAKEKPSG